MNKISVPLVILVALVGLATVLKVTTLDRKVLWAEETYSLDILSGRTSSKEIDQEVDALIGQVTTAGQMAKLANMVPDANLYRVATYIYKNDLRHVSVFYLGLFPIAKYIGESTFQLRFLPMIISVLGLLALWWLGGELGAGVYEKWLSLALYSCSTVFFFYSQTIREYSMWAAMIFVAHAALLYAVRKGTAISWMLYAALLCSALYTFCLSALLIPSHAFWFFCRRSERRSTRHFMYAVSAAVILYSPLIITYLLRGAEVETGNRWKDFPFWSVADYAIRVCAGLGRFFFDSELEGRWNIGLVCGVGIVALILCQLPHILKERKSQFALFIFMTVPLTIIVVYDVATNSIAISFSRLLIIVAAPLTPLVAMLLNQSLHLSANKIPSMLSNLILLTLLLTSLWFAAFSPHLRHMRHVSLPMAAQVANSQDANLIVTFAGRAQRQWVGLARALPADTKWLVLKQNGHLDLSTFDRILIYKPRPSWAERLQSAGRSDSFHIKSFADDHFWLLTR